MTKRMGRYELESGKLYLIRARDNHELCLSKRWGEEFFPDNEIVADIISHDHLPRTIKLAEIWVMYIATTEKKMRVLYDDKVWMVHPSEALQWIAFEPDMIKGQTE